MNLFRTNNNIVSFEIKNICFFFVFVFVFLLFPERQRCALWIKKLCESPGSGTTGRWDHLNTVLFCWFVCLFVCVFVFAKGREIIYPCHHVVLDQNLPPFPQRKYDSELSQNLYPSYSILTILSFRIVPERYFSRQEIAAWLSFSSYCLVFVTNLKFTGNFYVNINCIIPNYQMINHIAIKWWIIYIMVVYAAYFHIVWKRWNLPHKWNDIGIFIRCNFFLFSFVFYYYRKNRNMYAKLLMHMLKTGVINGPFLQRPERGPLPTLPTYMVSISGLISYGIVLVTVEHETGI